MAKEISVHDTQYEYNPTILSNAAQHSCHENDLGKFCVVAWVASFHLTKRSEKHIRVSRIAQRNS